MSENVTKAVWVNMFYNPFIEVIHTGDVTYKSKEEAEKDSEVDIKRRRYWIHCGAYEITVELPELKEL